VEVLRKKEREGENRNETQCFSCYVFLTSQKTLIDQMEWGTHQFNNDIVAFSTYACAVSDDQADKCKMISKYVQTQTTTIVMHLGVD
jgi:hypothetical protein